ncbi:MAG: FtsX-like permease family protein [Planctomycetaceae bacterium]|jgi:putative ABC transport system permease protein|nr:FtsX-like permease family protein [Planctomycetaceae bacterium]
MPLWKIAYRSIQFRKVSSILTAISMSLGAAIIVTVLVIHGVLSDSFNKGAQGYDLIIAGKGSPRNVVLSTVFYLGDPVGDVPESYLKMFRKGQYSHLAEEAIPITIGHHFRGATIVGTSPEFFSKLKYFGDKTYSFADGENFRFGADYTAVAGFRAAKKAGLKVGDEFTPEAAQDAETDTHHEPFKVVGILNPTGTPNDAAIFVNIDGFYEMHSHGEHTGHNHEGHEHAEEQRRYSAILLMTKQNVVKPEGTGIDPNAPDFDPSKMLAERSYVNIDAMQLPQLLDKTTDVQAVSPVREIADLLSSIVGNIQMVLIFLAVLVVITAGIGMMTAIYNSMSERKQEIAVMRALGARRLTVMSIILLESILLSLGGGFLGVLLGHLLIGGISPWISEYTGIIVRCWNFQWTEMILIPGLILLASIVGFLPALVAYKQDVAASL